LGLPGGIDAVPQVRTTGGLVILWIDRKTADGLSAARCAGEGYMGGEYGARRALCEEGAALLGVPALRHATMAHVAALSGEVRKRCEFIVGENERVLAMSDALSVGDRGAIRCLCAGSFVGARDLYEICLPSMLTMMAAPGSIGARQVRGPASHDGALVIGVFGSGLAP
jgi:galactokinase